MFTGVPSGPGAPAALEGDWTQASPASTTDEAYGHHRLLFRPPLDPPGDGEAAPSIALVSHLDTVFPEEELAAAGHAWDEDCGAPGWIRGPGTMDCKGGTVTARAALDALRVAHPQAYRRCAIHVWLNAAEEPLCWDFAAQCRRFALACGAVDLPTAAGGHASAGGAGTRLSAGEERASGTASADPAPGPDGLAADVAAARARLLDCASRVEATAPAAADAPAAAASAHRLLACFVLEAGITRLQGPGGEVPKWAAPAFEHAGQCGDASERSDAEAGAGAASAALPQFSDSSAAGPAVPMEAKRSGGPARASRIGPSLAGSLAGGPAMLVVRERRGMLVWRVHLAGRAAHAGNAHQTGRSAALAAARFAILAERANEAVASATSSSCDSGQGPAPVTVNVGKIEAGATHNTVPDRATVLVEMRAADASGFELGEGMLAAAVRAIDAEAQLPGSVMPSAARGASDALAGAPALAASAFGERQHGIRVSVEERVRAAPWARTAGGDQLAATAQEVASDLGLECGIQVRGGLSDANNLWALAPCIDAMGPHGLGAHNAADKDDVPAERLFWPSALPKAAILAEVVARVVCAAE
ncbi:hypothetical protein FNF31_03818 [Cafeteria roenbergensis]|uniref:Peptidase M20 dimerisation domain-containing protein n=1 Tax=Cafeteria roenbergensis TaxID=33653 RepID=A0A5A8D860_CAFRO|nr:hypothetical protein FNF31_03818 [Cafeteria roenbergensis]